jgi:hypothetical protein
MTVFAMSSPHQKLHVRFEMPRDDPHVVIGPSPHQNHAGVLKLPRMIAVSQLLPQPINDPRLCQVVGRHLDLHAITRRQADETFAHAT